jgi:hypothetical protein
MARVAQMFDPLAAENIFEIRKFPPVSALLVEEVDLRKEGTSLNILEEKV